MAEMYPVFLKLEGRPVLVVGAGKVALRKVEALLEAGAAVRVVAPEVCPGLQELAAAGRLVLQQRPWQIDDCAGTLLVVAATGDAALNAQIRQSARTAGALVNAVDDPDNCDFYVPAVARRGDLRIAVSTQGAAPLIASRVREHLEKTLPVELADVIEAVSAERARLLASGLPEQARLRRLRVFLNAELEHWGLKL
ncbi:MAG: bifunctional precorrin-2 dehydrogenase/sirohydrochlorin ferrochelatase [Planctomycetota bacterium]|nr:bifunctional precorrin-2 dehydrogenase/sirohydrochlorin ferrochelatase [Planctomycetota bacterium]